MNPQTDSAFIEDALGALTPSSHAGASCCRGSCARCRGTRRSCRGGTCLRRSASTIQSFSSIGGWATVSRLRSSMASATSAAPMRRDSARHRGPFHHAAQLNVYCPARNGQTVCGFRRRKISRGAAFAAHADGLEHQARIGWNVLRSVAQGGHVDPRGSEMMLEFRHEPACRARGRCHDGHETRLRLHGPFAPPPSRIARVPGDRPTASARRGSDDRRPPR